MCRHHWLINGVALNCTATLWGWWSAKRDKEGGIYLLARIDLHPSELRSAQIVLLGCVAQAKATTDACIGATILAEFGRRDKGRDTEGTAQVSLCKWGWRVWCNGKMWGKAVEWHRSSDLKVWRCGTDEQCKNWKESARLDRSPGSGVYCLLEMAVQQPGAGCILDRSQSAPTWPLCGVQSRCWSRAVFFALCGAAQITALKRQSAN